MTKEKTQKTTAVNTANTPQHKGSSSFHSTGYSSTLAGEKGWKPSSTDGWTASNLALRIMAYRRQYRSSGIANFVAHWLEPTLLDLTTTLRVHGYTVAVQVVGTEAGKKNYCIDVSRDDTVGTTLFVAHYDTVDRDYSMKGTVPYVLDKATKKYVPDTKATAIPERLIKEITVKDGIARLDLAHKNNIDVGCLGADDGAGLAVMLRLMSKGVIGGYCFTTGEECGGIGADEVLQGATAFLKQYKRSVEVDRRGTSEIVYSQGAGDCASIAFTQWLCDTLGMGHKPSPNGSYTDVATFAEVIPENVNVASGYTNAHTPNEQVDLVYLDNLATALGNISVELWEQSPCERVAGDFGSNNASFGNWYDDYDTRTLTRKGADTELSTNTVLTLFQLDKDFMTYALRVGMVNNEDLDYLLQEFYGEGLDNIDYILLTLL